MAPLRCTECVSCVRVWLPAPPASSVPPPLLPPSSLTLLYHALTGLRPGLAIVIPALETLPFRRLRILPLLVRPQDSSPSLTRIDVACPWGPVPGANWSFCCCVLWGH